MKELLRSTIRWLGIPALLLLCPLRVCAATEAAEEPEVYTEEAETETASDEKLYSGWDKTTPIRCRDDRTACCLLQMIMMGEFEDADLEDMLSLRIFSAAADRLQLITSEDISHFCEEFGEDPDFIRECFYQTYSVCLLAQIRFENKAPQDLDNARQVLLLFLDPSEENAEDQMQEIRENMTPEVEAVLAKSAGMDIRYIKWLLELSN